MAVAFGSTPINNAYVGTSQASRIYFGQTLVWQQRPVVTSASLTITIGVPFSYQITATNDPHLSYGATGLPAGLTVNTSTGVISGTPTSEGTSSITISATNTGGTGSAVLTLTVTGQVPAITSSLTATATVGVAFSYQITASGSPTSFNATGLPAGLSVDTTTGVISGTPTSEGTSSVTLSATNSGGTGSATLTLTVQAAVPGAPVITSPTTATATVGVAFSYTITATNSPTSFAATGLPAGLSLNTSTGVISGTPTTQGTSSISISATNSGGTGTATLSLEVLGLAPVVEGVKDLRTSPVVTEIVWPTGGILWSYYIQASNSPTTYGFTQPPVSSVGHTWTLDNVGRVRGGSLKPGVFQFTVTATNSNGTGSRNINFTTWVTQDVISGARNGLAVTPSGRLLAISYNYTSDLYLYYPSENNWLTITSTNNVGNGPCDTYFVYAASDDVMLMAPLSESSGGGENEAQLLVSTNGGATWVKRGPIAVHPSYLRNFRDHISDPKAAVISQNGQFIAAIYTDGTSWENQGRTGIWVSSDNGITWAGELLPYTDFSNPANNIVGNPLKDWLLTDVTGSSTLQVIYAAAAMGYSAAQNSTVQRGRIWVSRNYGQTFTLEHTGPTLNTGVNPQLSSRGKYTDLVCSENGLYAATAEISDTDVVTVTSDTGNNWTRRDVTGRWGLECLVAMAGGSSASDLPVLFYAGKYGYFAGGNWELYRSNDLGVTWTLILSESPSDQDYLILKAKKIAGQVVVYLVKQEVANRGKVPSKIYVSTDGGNSWGVTPLRVGLPVRS